MHSFKIAQRLHIHELLRIDMPLRCDFVLHIRTKYVHNLKRVHRTQMPPLRTSRTVRIRVWYLKVKFLLPQTLTFLLRIMFFSKRYFLSLVNTCAYCFQSPLRNDRVIDQAQNIPYSPLTSQCRFDLEARDQVICMKHHPIMINFCAKLFHN